MLKKNIITASQTGDGLSQSSLDWRWLLWPDTSPSLPSLPVVSLVPVNKGREWRPGTLSGSSSGPGSSHTKALSSSLASRPLKYFGEGARPFGYFGEGARPLEYFGEGARPLGYFGEGARPNVMK